jgi:hypothetical protein
MIGPRVLRLLVPLACVLLWKSAAWAANPNLERARRQLDDLKYDEAAASLEQALRVGESGPKELAEIYLLSAQVAAARGDDAAAEDFFRHLLALAPETKLPAGVSPKIAQPFQQARSFIEQRLPIAVRWEQDPSGAAVRVLVDADPLSMVHGAEVVWFEDGSPKRVVRHGNAPYVIPVPKQSDLELRIAAVDEFGNHIAEFGSAKKPLVIDTSNAKDVVVKPKEGDGDGGGGGGPSDSGGGRPVVAKWWLWGGVSLVAAGVGTYFGLDVLAAKQEIEDLNAKSLAGGERIQFSEAKAIQDRGDRSALLANVSFGVAGAAAVAAVILFATEPKGGGASAPAEKDQARRGSRLVPAMGGDRVGLVWVGSF